jgi:hypothetical protein
MAPRLDLHNLLLAIVDKVYFQPPANIQLEYPCIVYSRDSADTKFADDRPYNYTQRYQITVIDRDPDSSITARVALLPQTTYSRFFAADNLNHDVFSLYY